MRIIPRRWSNSEGPPEFALMGSLGPQGQKCRRGRDRLPELERNGVSGQQAVEERLALLLVRVFVSPRGLVERLQQFLPPLVAGASDEQFVNQRLNRVIVSNRVFMRVACHRDDLPREPL